MSFHGDRARLAFRVVQGATLAALLWKWQFFRWSYAAYIVLPMESPFFPWVFESPATFALAYLTAVIATGASMLAPRPRVAQLCSGLALGSTSVLCVHLGSYNDATFTTAWWTLLWSTWFAGRLASEPALALQRGARLSRAIVSLVLLGGAVGKWTGEYWSGQVLYEIYFVDRDFWVFNALRNTLDAEGLRTVATWYSRLVVMTESVCGLGLWLLPSRLAAGAGVAVLLAIATFSNPLLASVVLSVAGLATVGFWDRSARQGRTLPENREERAVLVRPGSKVVD